jgi:hypothetical protein
VAGVPQVSKGSFSIRRFGNSSRFFLYGVCAVSWSLVAVTAASGAQPVRAGTGTPEYPQTGAFDAAFPITAAPGQDTLVAASFQLPALLGQHSVLVSDMTRGRLRSDPDLAQATNAAISKNTAELGGLVKALYGDAAAAQFSTLWAGHVQAYFNYARGLAEKDSAIQAQSTATIRKFEVDLAAFFSTASGGRLSKAAADAVVKVHLLHLLHQANAYSAGNYAQADGFYRAAYAQGYDLGVGLANALLPTSVTAVMKTPAWQLQSSLDRLLGEHVVLVVAAMRSAATNNPDFAATAASVDGNTKDLSAAVGTLFGAAAGNQFMSLWADHVDALIAYSAAIAKNDSAQRAEARATLSGFERRLTEFLSGATKNRLVGQSVAKALGAHDAMLMNQVEAFVAKDYTKSHDLAYSTYRDIITLGGQMATAFRLTLGGRLPTGGPETGKGGLATVVEHR